MAYKIKTNRIKPKYNGKNKKKITSEDKEYLEWLQNQSYKCFVCGKINPNDPIEWHHIKLHSTDKKNHKRLIPLCGSHHRLSNDISAHSTPKKFRKLYPIEMQNEFADKIYRKYIKTML
ncbi:MAG: HNH endonuclease signature motif containing protein [Sulfurimonas denitrificans]|nr:HNH endonuclease signature motif containing protein [Sulfurimonas denitrificans]